MNKFRLAGVENKEPISLSVEFYCKKKYFIFSIEFNEEKIIKEELIISGLGIKGNTNIYSRTGNRPIFKNSNNTAILNATTKLLKGNPLSSLLSLIKEFPILEDDRSDIAREWFEKYLSILSLRRVNPSLISRLSKKSDLLEFTNTVFNEIGLGIKKVGVDERKLNDILLEDDEEAKLIKADIQTKLEKGLLTDVRQV